MVKEKVVVIGGSGFMGSHTADELTKRGYKVVIYDSICSPWITDGQEMVVGSILDSKALIDVTRDAKYVYHFAGIADIKKAKENPLDTINLNVMGASSVLDACVKSSVERFVYASTMYVYSTSGSFYRASKQAAEILIEAYSDKYNIDYTLLRYGSLYGPRSQNWNGLRKYVHQILADGKIDFPGTGNERREFIHVIDAARLSVDVLDDKHKNQAITVTGQQVFTLHELIEMIFEIANKKPIINYIEKIADNDHYALTPYRYTPKQATKLVPDEFVDLGQGILDLVEKIHHEIK